MPGKFRLHHSLLALSLFTTPLLANWTLQPSGPGGMLPIATDANEILGVMCLPTVNGSRPLLLINSEQALSGFPGNTGPDTGFLSIKAGGQSELKLFGYVSETKDFIIADTQGSRQAIDLLRRKNRVELMFIGSQNQKLGSVDLAGSSKALRQLSCK